MCAILSLMTQTSFLPSDDQWQARLKALDPKRYGATRNHLNGAVSGLSPYFTHGFLSTREAVEGIRHGSQLTPQDKLFAEFAWRSFFHHVWSHQGDAIFHDLRAPLPGVRYASELPADIRAGRTGLPVIDQAVAALYGTGYLHNHARMWLASYVVHLRHVHWRAGADWLYGHLLDGDLASNHLSWQWVASTFSVKPYLFNADNVAKYAPCTWRCEGTPLDTSYEALEAMARGENELGRLAFETLAQQAERQAFGLTEPLLCPTPPQALMAELGYPQGEAVARAVSAAGAIELVHAWALRAKSLANPSEGRRLLRLGVIHLPAHVQRPWSARRWAFVLKRMSEICGAVFIGDAHDLKTILPANATLFADCAVGNAETFSSLSKLKPHWLEAPALLREPASFCGSFSKYFRAAQSVEARI